MIRKIVKIETLRKFANFLADYAIVCIVLCMFVGTVRCLHVDLDEVQATDDTVTDLGKEVRLETEEANRQEKVLRDQAAIMTGIK